ncbi:hypothetical protein F2P81_018085 [Scophthalmus maximus]|uniref:Uncharacterized protein n=1 Tax=Scophthalmus maximus TaxID=52904 RepID=A0A6A4SB99_SCOMX|nr:hypothetical protein F2P81_018085 [Scophthalmus maximus]
MHRNINKIETVADISDEDISANQSQLYKSSDSSSVMRRNYVNLTDTTSVVIVFSLRVNRHSDRRYQTSYEETVQSSETLGGETVQRHLRGFPVLIRFMSLRAAVRRLHEVRTTWDSSYRAKWTFG